MNALVTIIQCQRTRDGDPLSRKRLEQDQSWGFPRMILVILSPSIDLRFRKLLATRRSASSMSIECSSCSEELTNIYCFDKPASSEAITTSSCCVGSGGLFTCSFYIRNHAITHGTKRQIAAEQMVTHCTNRLLTVELMIIRHTYVVVCGELTLRLLHDSNIVVGETKPNWHAHDEKHTKLIARHAIFTVMRLFCGAFLKCIPGFSFL